MVVFFVGWVMAKIFDTSQDLFGVGDGKDLSRLPRSCGHLIFNSGRVVVMHCSSLCNVTSLGAKKNVERTKMIILECFIHDVDLTAESICLHACIFLFRDLRCQLSTSTSVNTRSLLKLTYIIYRYVYIDMNVWCQ